MTEALNGEMDTAARVFEKRVDTLNYTMRTAMQGKLCPTNMTSFTDLANEPPVRFSLIEEGLEQDIDRDPVLARQTNKDLFMGIREDISCGKYSYISLGQEELLLSWLNKVRRVSSVQQCLSPPTPTHTHTHTHRRPLHCSTKTIIVIVAGKKGTRQQCVMGIV